MWGCCLAFVLEVAFMTWRGRNPYGLLGLFSALGGDVAGKGICAREDYISDRLMTVKIVLVAILCAIAKLSTCRLFDN